jgi:hypothetical protein
MSYGVVLELGEGSQVTLVQVVSLLGSISSLLIAAAGGIWALYKWRRSDELFPRIYFEVSCNFLGPHQTETVTEVIATIENRGLVPLRLYEFSFGMHGLKRSDDVDLSDIKIRNQLKFPHFLRDGTFISKKMEYTFVYPGIKTEYNFVTSVPEEYSFIRVHADFVYDAEKELTHHAAKIFSVPRRATETRHSTEAAGA